MRKLYLFLLSGMLLASCVKEELPQPPTDGEPVTVTLTRSAGENDPYKLSLVQEVLDAQCAAQGLPRIELKPTHQYVCFSPADSAQVARLEALDIVTFNNPIGDYTPIPEPDENTMNIILPLYSVVPVDFKLPEGIACTKIYDVYIQSLGGPGTASGTEEQLPTEQFKDVLTQTLAATGKTPAVTRTGEPQEWTPSARFRFHINVGNGRADTLPLKQLHVMVVQGSNHKNYYTNANGEINVTDKFIGPVDYQVVWDSDYFVIRQGNTWSRRTALCRRYTAPLDTVFTAACGLDYFIAGSHRALTAYYTEPNLVPGLVREGKLLDIGIINKKTPFKWSGRYVPIATTLIGEHPLAMYAKSDGGYKSSKTGMQMTFHELGHASHYANSPESYLTQYPVKTKNMESWANGVSYAYTRALLGEEYVWDDTTDKDYTRVIECLLQNGFTMVEIQHDYYGSNNWDHWRARTKARSDKPISDQLVDLIFDNPNDYHFDMRDMIIVTQSTLRLFEPTVFREKDLGIFPKVTWTITEGTGGMILNTDEHRQEMYFTEPGRKTIRATVELAPGIEKTFDQTVTVENSSIISVPETVVENYPVTVSIMDIPNCPNAKVTEWSVVPHEARITPKTDRSAQYQFMQPGKMTITVKIRFQLGMSEVECTAPINVQPLDVNSVFAVIDPPQTYAYNTNYKAKYMGTASNVEITNVEADHRTHLPYYDFDSWSYDKYNKTLTFQIPQHPLSFDYKLIIHYKVNGVEVEEPAILVVSNIKESTADA